MKLPQSLIKYGGSNAATDAAAEDDAFVKVRTLKRWIARAIRMIPMAGAGFALRNTPDGDVWTLTQPAKPFQVSSGGVIHPGLVGGLMPTLSGDPLDATTNTLTMSGTFKVWFKLTFSVTYLSSYLSSYTLTSVIVETGSSVPSDTDSVKYLQLNTITNGVPRASFFSSSISVSLWDNGANDTTLHYGSAA